MEKWLEYIERMVKGLPLRKICDELEISLNTAFNWRHKVLEALKSLSSMASKGFWRLMKPLFSTTTKAAEILSAGIRASVVASRRNAAYRNIWLS